MATTAPNVSESFKAEFGELDLVKGISILDSTEYENFDRALFVFLLAFDCEGRPGENIDRIFRPWPHHYFYLTETANFIRTIWRHNKDTRFVTDVVCWGLASIFECNVRSQYVARKSVKTAIFGKT